MTEEVSEVLPCVAKGVSFDISTGTMGCGQSGSMWWSKRESRLACADGEGGGQKVFIQHDGSICE